MSVGSNLQEMENVVTKGAAPAEPMPNNGIDYEDLGGPTPENSRPDDDSNQLKTPGATLAQVRDVVNAKAMKAESVEEEEDLVDEDEADEEEEVVAEAVDEEEPGEAPHKEGKKEKGEKKEGKGHEKG